MKRWGTITLMLFAFVVGFTSTYNCGGGSTAQGAGDADTLQGHPASFFAVASHNHSDYAMSVHPHTSSDITGSIDADTLEGMSAGDFAPMGHGHVGPRISGFVSVPFVPAWVSYGTVKREYCFDSTPGDEYHHQVNGAYADSTYLWNGWMSDEADSTTFSKFYVPVQLPDGATITSFHIVAYDNDQAHDARVFFRRSEAIRGQNYRVTGSTLYTSGASNVPEIFPAATINPDMELVDNSQYSYNLEAKLIGGSDVVLISAVVGYEFQ